MSIRRFLLRLIAFGIVQVTILIIIFSVYQRDRDSFLGDGIDKHKAARLFPSPKVLLIGGSSVGFGRHSPVLSNALGLPVVNLSGQGSQGLEYRLREAKSYAQKGDILVMSIEYQVLTDRSVEGFTVWRTLEAEPEDYKFIDASTMLSALADSHLFVRYALWRLSLRLAKGAWPKDPAPYSRTSLNPEGDVVGHYDLPRQGFSRDFEIRYSESDLTKVVERLNGFAEFCARNRIRVYYFYPAFPESLLPNVAAALDLLHARFSADLRIPLLNNPREMAYPDTDFYDTPYHLIRDAGIRSTLLIADRLKGLR